MTYITTFSVALFEIIVMLTHAWHITRFRVHFIHMLRDMSRDVYYNEWHHNLEIVVRQDAHTCVTCHSLSDTPHPPAAWRGSWRILQCDFWIIVRQDPSICVTYDSLSDAFYPHTAWHESWRILQCVAPWFWEYCKARCIYMRDIWLPFRCTSFICCVIWVVTQSEAHDSRNVTWLLHMRHDSSKCDLRRDIKWVTPPTSCHLRCHVLWDEKSLCLPLTSPLTVFFYFGDRSRPHLRHEVMTVLIPVSVYVCVCVCV